MMHKSKVQDVIFHYMLFIDGHSMSTSTMKIAIEILYGFHWIPGADFQVEATSRSTSQLKPLWPSWKDESLLRPRKSELFFQIGSRILCWTWNGLWWYYGSLCELQDFFFWSWTMIRYFLRARQWLNYGWTDGTMIRHLDYYILLWSA